MAYLFQCQDRVLDIIDVAQWLHGSLELAMGALEKKCKEQEEYNLPRHSLGVMNVALEGMMKSIDYAKEKIFIRDREGLDTGRASPLYPAVEHIDEASDLCMDMIRAADLARTGLQLDPENKAMEFETVEGFLGVMQVVLEKLESYCSDLLGMLHSIMYKIPV